MKLTDFLAQTEQSPAEFADVIGDVSASGVRKWMNGERVPRPDQMRRIYEATKGDVAPNDFYLTHQQEVAQ